jgi:hypothetical protein
MIVTGTLNAQMDDSKLIMGTKAAYGHSFMYPYKNTTYNSSWAIGLTTMYAFTEKMALGVDALYSEEGATFKSGDLKVASKLDYLRVPVKFYYTMGDNESNFRPRLFAGPTIGFIMEGSEPGYSSTDFGVNVGAGFQYRLTRGLWLTTDADYYHGFADIYKANTESDRNGNIRLDIGIMVGF